MNQLFLLKMIAELLEGDPTKDQIDCARKILKGMIEEYEKKPIMPYTPLSDSDSDLDPEAEAARRELQ